MLLVDFVLLALDRLDFILQPFLLAKNLILVAYESSLAEFELFLLLLEEGLDLGGI